MKNRLSITFIIMGFITTCPVFANINTDFISNVEKTLFIYSYKNENMSKRLNRIELNVYGHNNNKLSEIQRIDEIKKVFPSLIIANQQKVKTQKSSQKNVITVTNKTQKSPQQNHYNTQTNKPAPNIEKYPILDEMEKKVFNKTFSTDDIYARLDRIEIKVFNSKSNGSLIDRVENLKTALIPPKSNNSNNTDKNYAYNNDLSSDKIEDVKKLLEGLEIAEFGTDYNKDTIENRIERLETKVFNSVSSEDPITERLERLVAVQQAQPSSQVINSQAGTLPQQAFTNRLTQIGTLLFILLSLIL